MSWITAANSQITLLHIRCKLRLVNKPLHSAETVVLVLVLVLCLLCVMFRSWSKLNIWVIYFYLSMTVEYFVRYWSQLSLNVFVGWQLTSNRTGQAGRTSRSWHSWRHLSEQFPPISSSCWSVMKPRLSPLLPHSYLLLHLKHPHRWVQTAFILCSQSGCDVFRCQHLLWWVQMSYSSLDQNLLRSALQMQVQSI